jgi:hypothetical protein
VRDPRTCVRCHATADGSALMLYVSRLRETVTRYLCGSCALDLLFDAPELADAWRRGKVEDP